MLNKYTAILKQMKNDDNLELWDIKKAMKSLFHESNMKYAGDIFEFVVGTNLEGRLPTYKDMKKYEPLKDAHEKTMRNNIYFLDDNNFIIKPFIRDICNIFGEQIINKTSIPANYGNSQVYIALIKNDEIPVYSKIFYE